MRIVCRSPSFRSVPTLSVIGYGKNWRWKKMRDTRGRTSITRSVFSGSVTAVPACTVRDWFW